MSEPYTHMNWCPDTFEEFCSAALAGQVSLNIMDTQWAWLYKNILPFRFQLWSIFSAKSYETRLLEKMIADEATFWAVHRKGIDLILVSNKRH